MMQKRVIKTVANAVLALAFCGAVPVACGGSGDPSSQSSETGSTLAAESKAIATAATPLGEPTFTRTIVSRAADGTEKVVVNQVTSAQQLAEHNERLAIQAGAKIPETLTVDTCTSADILLFDGAELNGNEICFRNGGSSTDSAYLPNYCESFTGFPLRCSGYWAGSHIASWDNITGGQAASVTAASGGPCGFSCLIHHPCVCYATVNLPAGSSACGACGEVCTYCNPTNIDSTMNYLWMGTGSGGLCSLCPNN